MEINIRSDSKFVEVWLGKSEKQDATLHVKLKSIYQECKTHGYMVVEFISGTEPLPELTSELLCYNRKRIAQLEVAREKAEYRPSVAL